MDLAIETDANKSEELESFEIGNLNPRMTFHTHTLYALARIAFNARTRFIDNSIPRQSQKDVSHE